MTYNIHSRQPCGQRRCATTPVQRTAGSIQRESIARSFPRASTLIHCKHDRRLEYASHPNNSRRECRAEPAWESVRDQAGIPIHVEIRSASARRGIRIHRMPVPEQIGIPREIRHCLPHDRHRPQHAEHQLQRRIMAVTRVCLVFGAAEGNLRVSLVVGHARHRYSGKRLRPAPHPPQSRGASRFLQRQPLVNLPLIDSRLFRRPVYRAPARRDGACRPVHRRDQSSRGESRSPAFANQELAGLPRLPAIRRRVAELPNRSGRQRRFL